MAHHDFVSSSTERNGAALMEEFRMVLRNPSGLLQGFITQGAELVPEHVWRKAWLWACASGQTDFVAEFIKSSPWQNLIHDAKDADGYTALHRAVISCHQDIVKMLSNRIAYHPFTLLHARTEEEGWTALHMAVSWNDYEMVDLLLTWYDNIKPNQPNDWDFRDYTWMTPLHYGVLGAFQKVVKRMLKSEAFRGHVNSVDYFRRSALHMACGHKSPVVENLLDNDVDRYVDENAVDCCQYTPLHWAVYAGAADAVRCFTSKASERTIRATEEDIQGHPVLQIAIENRTIDHKVGRDIQKLLLTVPEVKDEVERLYRDRQVFVDAANAILVGAALIASVTFGGWLQPPNGEDQDVVIFWTFNSLSFFFSIATVMAGAGTVLPMSDVYIGKTVRSIRRWLALTSFLLLISVVLVLGAFAAAGFASLPPVPTLHDNMVTTTCVGTVVCAIIGVMFLIRLIKIRAMDDVKQFISSFNMFRGTRRPSMVEVNAALDASRTRVIQSAGADYTSKKQDGAHLESVDLFEKACERDAAIERETVHGERALKTRVFDRMKVFEDAYLKVRSGLSEEEAAVNMAALTELMPAGLHFWSDFSSALCRERALKKDKELWDKIKNRIQRKKSSLEDENTRFYYSIMSFDDWDV